MCSIKKTLFGLPQCLLFVVLGCLAFSHNALAQADATEQASKDAQAKGVVEALEEPLYNPFVERYVLDEIKQLRVEMAAQRIEFTLSLIHI